MPHPVIGPVRAKLGWLESALLWALPGFFASFMQNTQATQPVQAIQEVVRVIDHGAYRVPFQGSVHAACLGWRPGHGASAAG